MKSLRLSIIAMSVGAIVGCGGEDSSGSDTKTKAMVYQAEVADEHLQDALVWLDINNNYQLDAGEPNSYTDSTGKALLEVKAIDTVPQAYSLIASAVKDRTINRTTGEKVSKSYMMVAPAGVQRISPVSHLVYSKQKVEGFDFAKATTTVAAIIDEVSEQELLEFLNKQSNQKLQALSNTLASVMPEVETPLTHQQLVQSHPDLEMAVAAFNDRSIKKLEADLGVVSAESPVPAIVGQTATNNVSGLNDNKQSVETGLSVPSIQSSTPTTTTETDHPNLTGESAPVKAVLPTLELVSETSTTESQETNNTKPASEEVTTRTGDPDITSIPESNPPVPEQPLSPEQGTGEGNSSGVVTETEITGNSQPNEMPPTTDTVTAGTGTHGTAQVPESNPPVPDQPLSPEQGTGEGTSSGVVTETETTGNSLPNETPPTTDTVTAGTDTQGSTQVPESNPPVPEQSLSPEEGTGEGTLSGVVTETEMTGNSGPSEIAPPLEPVTTGAVIDATTQNPLPNNTQKQPVETPVATDLDTLLTRVLAGLVTAEENRAQSQSKSLDVLASELIYGLQADGRWLDIDYQQPNNYRRPAEQHLERLQTIAAAFRKTNNQEYKLQANKALNFWLITKPVMTGWWSEYGENHSLAKVAFLLGDGLREDLKPQVVSLLANAPSKQQLGLNRVDEAVTSIYYGLLSQQESLLSTGFGELDQIILDTAVDIESPDWSAFLSQQLHSGKTGEETFYSILHWAYNVNDLPWRFSEYSAQILASILLDGIRWMQSFELLGSDLHSGEISQQVETTQSGSSISKLLTSMDMVAALFPTRNNEAIAYKGQVYDNQVTGLNGFKQFLLADSTVTATDNFMFGIKMDSIRALPEANDDAHIKFWMGLGSTSLIQSGKEHESLNSVLDYTKISGVTAPNYPMPPTYDSDTFRHMDFYGGATNGKVGVTTASINMSAYRVVGNGPTQQYVWTPSTTVRDELHANKSWFSFGEQIVVLGSGISSTHLEPVFTTISQTAFKGTVTLSNKDNLVYGNYDISPYPWIHHDGVGYVFWDHSERLALVENRQAVSADGTKVSKNVFTLTIPHGSEPKDKSYQYIMLPNIDVQKMSEYQKNIPVKVLSNTRGIHAVEDTSNNIISAVFFVASELEVSPDYKIKVDSPSVIVLDRNGSSTKVTVSTPAIAYRGINITITDNGVVKTYRVVTPGGEKTGSSVSFDVESNQGIYPLDDPQAFNGYMTHLPVEDVFVQGGGHLFTQYGSLGYMQVKNGTDVNHRRSLIRYDLSLVELQDISKATLRLFVRGIRNDGTLKRSIVARLVHTSDWNEINTTYSTFPQVTTVKESPPTYLGRESGWKWIDIDVTDLVRVAAPEQKGNLVFELADLTPDYLGDYVSFATKEFGYKGPQLILE